VAELTQDKQFLEEVWHVAASFALRWSPIVEYGRAAAVA
jgi:hypothetical protein